MSNYKKTDDDLMLKAKKRDRKINKYTLNDAKFSPEPLTLFVPDPNYKVDEEKLKKDSQANRERMETFIKDFKKITHA